MPILATDYATVRNYLLSNGIFFDYLTKEDCVIKEGVIVLELHDIDKKEGKEIMTYLASIRYREQFVERTCAWFYKLPSTLLIRLLFLPFLWLTFVVAATLACVITWFSDIEEWISDKIYLLCRKGDFD